MSKASAGVMEIMPVFSVSHLQNFLTSAKENGWSILGTSGFPSAMDKKKQDENKKESRKLKTMNCQEYVKKSPVLLVVGMLRYIAC